MRGMGGVGVGVWVRFGGLGLLGGEFGGWERDFWKNRGFLVRVVIRVRLG